MATGAGEVSVTIKESKDFNASWFVFRGSPDQINKDLVAFFGLDQLASESLTTHQLAQECTAIAQGHAVAEAPAKKAPPRRAAAKKEAAPVLLELPAKVAEVTADPWADDVQPTGILGDIASATSADELRGLWNSRKAEITGDVLAAWQAKGRSLTEA